MLYKLQNIFMRFFSIGNVHGCRLQAAQHGYSHVKPLFALEKYENKFACFRSKWSEEV